MFNSYFFDWWKGRESALEKVLGSACKVLCVDCLYYSSKEFHVVFFFKKISASIV